MLVCDFVSGSTRFLANHGCCRYVDMWVRATGARNSKSLDRRCPRTACLRRGPKIIYSYYTRCELIRDGTTLHVQLRQKQRVSQRIVVARFQYYKCQVRGSFCEISEEYDVKLDYTVVTS